MKQIIMMIIKIFSKIQILLFQYLLFLFQSLLLFFIVLSALGYKKYRHVCRGKVKYIDLKEANRNNHIFDDDTNNIKIS